MLRSCSARLGAAGCAVQRRAASVDAVIVGGGIIGAATAYHLVHEQGKSAVLLSRDALLSVTSSVSTECYRGYWGSDAVMTEFVGVESLAQLRRLAAADRSVGLQERGYLYVTKNADVLQSFVRKSEAARQAIGGAQAKLRQPLLFDGGAALRQRYPFIADDACGGILVEDAGWLSAHSLGTALLEAAAATGRLTVVRNARVAALRTGRQHEVTAVQYCHNNNNDVVECAAVVNAAGPWLSSVHRQLLADSDDELPVVNELHAKVLINDRDVRALPADGSVPMVIGLDPVTLHWSPDELSYLRESQSPYAAMLAAGQPLPAGVHCRPSSCSSTVMLIWEFFFRQQQRRGPLDSPDWPIAKDVFDPLYAEACLRGMQQYVPALAAHHGRRYLDIDGGWYCKTPDARPLVGPTRRSPHGYVLAGGVAGVGIMSAMAVGRLAAQYALHKQDDSSPITQALLPSRIMGPPQYTGIADAR